jgi:L-lactate dehydrogenase complex protein LldG
LIEEKDWDELHCKDARLLHLFQQHELEGINSKKILSPKAVGITSAVQLIARTGSILINSSQAAGRTLNIAPEVHVVIASSNLLVYNIKEALVKQKEQMQPLPSMICLTTGASRTADIEKTLVMGAHGPRALYLFLLTT